MQPSTFKHYLTNCFLLTIPIMVWNMAFAGKLPTTYQPEIFWNNIPSFIAVGESISRIIVFALALFMPLSIKTKTQKTGLALYVVGLFFYFASWLALMYAPGSEWSSSLLGFAAPAYTPLLWLVGIGLIGDRLYFNWPYSRWVFMVVAIIFLVFHNVHTFIVYDGLQ